MLFNSILHQMPNFVQSLFRKLRTLWCKKVLFSNTSCKCKGISPPLSFCILLYSPISSHILPYPPISSHILLYSPVFSYSRVRNSLLFLLTFFAPGTYYLPPPPHINFPSFSDRDSALDFSVLRSCVLKCK